MLPTIACAAAVVALLVAGRLEQHTLAGIAKTAASLAFLWAGIAFGGLESSYGQRMLVGLVLCAVGDVLLIISLFSPIVHVIPEYCDHGSTEFHLGNTGW